MKKLTSERSRPFLSHNPLRSHNRWVGEVQCIALALSEIMAFCAALTNNRRYEYQKAMLSGGVSRGVMDDLFTFDSLDWVEWALVWSIAIYAAVWAGKVDAPI